MAAGCWDPKEPPKGEVDWFVGPAPKNEFVGVCVGCGVFEENRLNILKLQKLKKKS